MIQNVVNSAVSRSYCILAKLRVSMHSRATNVVTSVATLCSRPDFEPDLMRWLARGAKCGDCRRI